MVLLVCIYITDLFPLTTVGRCQRTSHASGVCSKRCRKSEASRFLPGLQSDGTKHHCLQRGGHRRDHSNRNPSGTQQWHDTRVRVDFIDVYILKLMYWVDFSRSIRFFLLCSVDCVGILKLRNADVEARIGVAGSKKKSTRARLAFRVNIPQPDGSVLTLQVPSSPILCSE